VQKKGTWEIIWQVIAYIMKSLQLKTIPVERIYISFGSWQSQIETNKLKPSDCHAHINIMLTKEVIKACKG
jgi:hypothetical protein